MPIWLMHTYAAHELGVFSIDDEQKQNAFHLGNFSPDWINFIPNGRSLYRRESHFVSKDCPTFMLSDFVTDFYEKAKSELERYFYLGYGFHIILDSIWSTDLFVKYLPHLVDKDGSRDQYYSECFYWDEWILKKDFGKTCEEVLEFAEKRFKNLHYGKDLIPPEGLEEVKRRASIFYNEAPEIKGTHPIFAEAEVVAAKDKAITLFRETFGNL